MELSEQKELVVQAYQRSLDLRVAYSACRLSKEEEEILNKDTQLQSRLDTILIQEKEGVYSSLKTIMQGGDSDTVRLKATIEIGRIIHPSRFIEGYDEELEEKKPLKVEVTHSTSGDLNEDQATQVLRILEKSGAIPARVEEAPTA